MKKLIFLIPLAFLLFACSSDEPKGKTKSTVSNEAKARFAGIKNNDQFVVGNDLVVRVQIKDLGNLENLSLFLNEKKVYDGIPESDMHVSSIKTGDLPVGYMNLKLVAKYMGGAEPTIDNRKVVFFSDKVPDMKMAKIQKMYSHDPTSYTQGLEFDGDQLWEGTGQRGSSLVAKVDLNSGKITEQIELEKTLFGEGITIMDDKIFQLTWQAGRCLVYDKNTMQKINEFTYSGEGWGLSNNGESLIMTNGSSMIVFRNPETFEVTKTIFAFDHSKEWPFLNEIEWVDGKIYANVYQRTDIIVINPETGKVEQVIDAYDADRELKMANPKSDVLNGIAYKKSTREFFITGKYFPNLAKVTFEADLP